MVDTGVIWRNVGYTDGYAAALADAERACREVEKLHSGYAKQLLEDSHNGAAFGAKACADAIAKLREETP